MERNSEQNLIDDYEYCDLVMKGGITSGVVYPAAAVELASKYRFKNIGGTSAGAIAAAVTAAAELGRRKTNSMEPFDVLKDLAKDLSKEGKLLKLFTPDASTRKAFRIAIGLVGSRTPIGRIVRTVVGIVLASVTWFAGGFTFGLLAPTLLYASLKWHSWIPVSSLICHHPYICALAGLSLGIPCGLLSAAIWSVINAVSAITSNGFGLCSGTIAASRTHSSLIDWIHLQIQRAARLNPQDPPLTFGDLWNAPLYSKNELHTPRMINLQMVTTSLTEGRPFSIPFLDGALYFDPQELGTLFPATIISWLVEQGKKEERNRHPNYPGTSGQGDARAVSSPSAPSVILFRLPSSQDLPVLVATRMSLSFPGLLSAVPLYRIDYSNPRNRDTDEKYATRIGSKVWFSDGGICSNFPITFFDSPLPRWPTFGINLRQVSSRFCDDESRNDDPTKLVYLPPPVGAVRVVWNWLGDAYWTATGEVERERPFDCLSKFVRSIFNTMQNWRDNLQATSPGYRDRIVTVKLCPDEGGLNLNMPGELISSLSERGKAAGGFLINRFDFSQHVFTRFRISLCALQSYLQSFGEAYSNPIPQDLKGWSFVNGTASPAHYKWSHNRIKLRAADAAIELNDLSVNWKTSLTEPEGFCTAAPRPEATLQSRPNF